MQISLFLFANEHIVQKYKVCLLINFQYIYLIVIGANPDLSAED